MHLLSAGDSGGPSFGSGCGYLYGLTRVDYGFRSPVAGCDVDPLQFQLASIGAEVDGDRSAVGEVEDVGAGAGGYVGFVGFAVAEQVHLRSDLLEGHDAFDLAGCKDARLGDVVEADTRGGAVEATGCAAGDEVAPESLHAVDGRAGAEVELSIGIDFRVVQRSGESTVLLIDPEHIGPVVLVECAAVDLGDVHEFVDFGIVEGLAQLGAGLGFVGVVEHVGDVDFSALGGGLGFDESHPVASPDRIRGCLVVHAVEHVWVFQAVREHLGDEAFLVFPHQVVHGLVLGHARDGVEEGVSVPPGRGGVLSGQAALGEVVVDVIGGVPRAVLPLLLGVVESVPDLDLDDDVALPAPFQAVLEAPPVLGVPLVHVEFAVVEELVGLEFDAFALAHSVADVIGADGDHLVEVGLEAFEQEDVVGPAAAEQQKGLAFVLPVAGVFVPRLDSFGVVGFFSQGCR